MAREVPLEELLRKPSGDRRTFHDDISVIVFFFDHEALQAPRPRLWHQVARRTSLSSLSSLYPLSPPLSSPTSLSLGGC